MLTEFAAREQATRSKNILIVDDEPDIRMLLGLFLQSHGHCVNASSNGEQAWQALMADPARWDLVLTDERMPVLTGRELLHRIREAGLHLPVVLVSGHVDEHAADVAQAGANGFVHKPFDLDDILSLVAALDRA